MWERLFRTIGYNPENMEMVIKRTIEINQIISSEGYVITGASASFSRKRIWNKLPKLTLRNTEGKKHISLPRPTAPREAKTLIAITYSLCYLNDVIDSSHVFYNDKKGVESSIASKHGPQKSAYMKFLISNLNDERLIERLTKEISEPLPSELTELQRDIIEKLSEGYLIHATAIQLMQRYNCNACELEDELEQIRRIKGLSERHTPEGIHWEEISFLHHTELEQEAITNAIESAEREIDQLADALKASIETHTIEMEKVTAELIQRIDRLENRGLIARILNKKM